MSHETIDRLESVVRSYCRSFPVTFTRASGCSIFDEDGREYLDFFGGAGALNYGHNNPVLKQALLDYIQGDGITHSLDMTTDTKVKWLETFEQRILKPRDMDYKVMFTGPTGTNSVESALKLARKVTGRQQVIAFTNAFHGMTLGALAVSGNEAKRAGAGVPLDNTIRLPFCGYFGEDTDTLDQLEKLLTDGSSGVEKPAAIIVETIQAEGGVNTASAEWLQRVQRIAHDNGAMFIVDDIQVGNGRTGPFFSFEDMDLDPDMICLSKSLSGYGLPFAVLLMKPEIDKWAPGEHNGTFRGFNLAFVASAAALDHYWSDDSFQKETEAKAAILSERFSALAETHGLGHRGRGLIQGLVFPNAEDAGRVTEACFDRGLIIETAGPDDEVLKFLAPLVIEERALKLGLDVIVEAVEEVLGGGSKKAANS